MTASIDQSRSGVARRDRHCGLHDHRRRTGQARVGNLGATFTWTETGGTRGTMVAQLSNGRGLPGPDVPDHPGKRVSTTARCGTAGDRASAGAAAGAAGAGAGAGAAGVRGARAMDTITQYSGQVLANLQGPGGFMRCHFTLDEPECRAWLAAALASASFRRERSSTRSSRVTKLRVRRGRADCGRGSLSWQIGRMATQLKPAHPAPDPLDGMSLPGWLYYDPEFFEAEKKAFLRAAPQVVCHESEIAEPGEWRSARISRRKRHRHSRRRRRGARLLQRLPPSRLAAGRRRGRLREGADLPLSCVELCARRAAGRRSASQRISGAARPKSSGCSRSRSRNGAASCS